jgi:hypothetical protein
MDLSQRPTSKHVPTSSSAPPPPHLLSLLAPQPMVRRPPMARRRCTDGREERSWTDGGGRRGVESTTRGGVEPMVEGRSWTEAREGAGLMAREAPRTVALHPRPHAAESTPIAPPHPWAQVWIRLPFALPRPDDAGVILTSLPPFETSLAGQQNKEDGYCVTAILYLCPHSKLHWLVNKTKRMIIVSRQGYTLRLDE